MKTKILITAISFMTLLAEVSCVSHRSHLNDKKDAVASIEIEVLKQMFADEGYTKATYGTIFFDVDKKTADYLPVLANSSTPRFEFGKNNLITTNHEFMDKVTMRPALIFRTMIMSISNNVALVEGGRIRSSLSGVWRVYTLNFVGTNWVIVDQGPRILSQIKANLYKSTLARRVPMENKRLSSFSATNEAKLAYIKLKTEHPNALHTWSRCSD